MDNLGYFPINYANSRARWQSLQPLYPVPAFFGGWKVPSATDNDLFTDHLFIPHSKEGRTLLVITSGVHGSESYAGSAIEHMFIKEILPTIDFSHVGLWLVHNMNPWGFKHHQRCTENGVNLNRNFSINGEMFKRDTPKASQLNDKFIPKMPVSSRKSHWLQTMAMKDGQPYFDGLSLDEFTKGVSPGQFIRKEYVEYGGKELEPSSTHFVHGIREMMPAYKNIIGLDLHTGLGERGRLHLIAGGGNERVDKSLLNEVFDPKGDADFYEYTPPEVEGYYEVYGGINAAFVELAKPGQRVCAVTMEFGTLGHSIEKQIEGMNSFFLEHQGQYYGYSTPKLEAEIKAENFARSFPDDQDWKNEIMNASRETFKRVIQRITRP